MSPPIATCMLSFGVVPGVRSARVAGRFLDPHLFGDDDAVKGAPMRATVDAI